MAHGPTGPQKKHFDGNPDHVTLGLELRLCGSTAILAWEDGMVWYGMVY